MLGLGILQPPTSPSLRLACLKHDIYHRAKPASESHMVLLLHKSRLCNLYYNLHSCLRKSTIYNNGCLLFKNWNLLSFCLFLISLRMWAADYCRNRLLSAYYHLFLQTIRPISVSFLIRTSGKDSHSQADSTTNDILYCSLCISSLLEKEAFGPF